MDLNRVTRKFILGESHEPPSVYSYLQSLREILGNMRPSTDSDRRRVEMAQNHLREIRRHSRKLQERVDLLEEQMKVLEEGKE